MLKAHLNYIESNRDANRAWWLQFVGEDGLRDLYDAGYLTTAEPERWIAELDAQ